MLGSLDYTKGVLFLDKVSDLNILQLQDFPVFVEYSHRYNKSAFLFLCIGFGGRGILPGVATGSQTGKLYVVYSLFIAL